MSYFEMHRDREDDLRINPLSPYELVEDLAQFDPSLALRVDSLSWRRYEGEDFGIQLDASELQPDVVDTADVQDAVEQIIANEWILGLTRYSYHHHKDQQSVKNSSVVGLWRAIETYDASESENLLAHISTSLTKHMRRKHGKPTVNVPSPVEFDSFVTEHYIEELQPLPSERGPQHFAEKDLVLVMEGEQLVPGIVWAVANRKGQKEFTNGHIPEEDVPAMQARLDSVYTRLALEGSRITLGDPAADIQEIAAFEDVMNPDVSKPAPDVRLIHMLGRGPVWLYSLHPQIIRNPDFKPSSVTIATNTHSDGIELEVADPQLITAAAWESLIDQPLFRELYLEEIGDEADQQGLRQAIYDRKQLGRQLSPPLFGDTPQRARPAHTDQRIIRVFK
jgi:hypothetical protein